jgi:hypothetical protein
MFTMSTATREYTSDGSPHVPAPTNPAARLDALAYDIYQSLAKLTHDDSVFIARAVMRHYRHLGLENGQ